MSGECPQTGQWCATPSACRAHGCIAAPDSTDRIATLERDLAAARAENAALRGLILSDRDDAHIMDKVIYGARESEDCRLFLLGNPHIAVPLEFSGGIEEALDYYLRAAPGDKT